jgi:O-succinylbenzoate synthase
MRIYTYKIPIATPLLPISERQGLIFQTEQGFGEAAPLPGWSRETIEDLLASIQSSISYPSADFGQSCARMTFPASFPSIPICALVVNKQDVEQALLNGFQTLKIKIKDYSVRDALDLISLMQFSGVRLRIDMNRKWSFNDAQRFLNQLDPLNIEYIEEPTDDLDQFHKLPPLPYALDETLREKENTWMRLPNVHAFVLKPTLLGKRLDHLIQLGQKLGKKLVFSSSFESAIALLHIAHLQKRFASQTAVGLDTHRFFQGNFFPMPIKNGLLSDDLLPPLDRTWLNDYVP